MIWLVVIFKIFIVLASKQYIQASQGKRLVVVQVGRTTKGAFALDNNSELFYSLLSCFLARIRDSFSRNV